MHFCGLFFFANDNEFARFGVVLGTTDPLGGQVNLVISNGLNYLFKPRDGEFERDCREKRRKFAV